MTAETCDGTDNRADVSASPSLFLFHSHSRSLSTGRSNCIFRNLSKCRRGIILATAIYFGAAIRVRLQIVVDRPPTRAARLGLFRSLRPQQLSDDERIIGNRAARCIRDTLARRVAP